MIDSWLQQGLLLILTAWNLFDNGLESEYKASRYIQLVLQSGLQMNQASRTRAADTAPKAAVGSRDQCRAPTGFAAKTDMTGDKVLNPPAKGKGEIGPRAAASAVIGIIGRCPQARHDIGQGLWNGNLIMVQEVAVILVNFEVERCPILR